MKKCRKSTVCPAGAHDFIQSKQKQIESMIQSQAGIIAKEKNIGIVMNKMSVPAGAVDITDEVLAKIDGGASKAASSQSK